MVRDEIIAVIYGAIRRANELRASTWRLAPWGITCNAVGPTPLETDLIRGVPREAIDHRPGDLPGGIS